MGAFLPMLGASLLSILVIMSALWCFYFFKRNAGIVDIGWTLGIVFVTLIYAIMGQGYWLRKLFILALVAAWGIRLSWYLISRFSIYEEDPRYKKMRTSWRGNVDFKVLLMFLFQGLIVVILSIPFLIICSNPKPSFHLMEGIGFLVWLLGFIGESISDMQLSEFKKGPGNQGRVCKEGWWKFSRHPNYFFEWVIWVGYFIIALASPYGWLAIVAPLLMFYLLYYVSGIPLAEEEALRTKGDAYREYQRTTSKFFPWFPKS